MEYYTATEKNELLLFITYMDFRNRKLRERSLANKHILCDAIFRKLQEQAELTYSEIKSEPWGSLRDVGCMLYMFVKTQGIYTLKLEHFISCKF